MGLASRMIIFVFTAMCCSPVLLICIGLILSLVTYKLCWKAFMCWRQELKTESCPFIICILEHLLEKTMQTDGWKTFQHNVILLKKHDCYQKQFMHTNFFLVHKKITSAFILIPIKQNCLQKEKTNTRLSFRTNLLKDSKGKINEVEWTDFVLLFTSDVLQVEQKWFKLVVIAIIYRLQWSPKVWCHIWDVYH